MSDKVTAILAILAAAAIALTGAGGAAAQPGAAVSASLALATSASRAVVRPGEEIEFTTVVRNQGATAATNVTVCDELPISVTRVPDPGGLHLAAGTACRTLPVLAPGHQFIARVVARIGRDTAPRRQPNTALVLWEGVRASATIAFRIGGQRCG